MKLDLTQLHARLEGVSYYGNHIVLIDNLDGEAVNADSKLLRCPMQLLFSTAICCVSGQMLFQINGQDHVLNASDLLVCHYGSICMFRGMDTNCRFMAFAFDKEYRDGTHLADEAIRIEQQFLVSPTSHFDKSAMTYFLTVFQLMKQTIKGPENRYRDIIMQGYKQVITATMFSYFLASNSAISSQHGIPNRHRQIFERFLNEVRLRYAENRDISFYAARLCLTPKYLSQIVHNVSGRFAKEWIDDYVLLNAKDMLESRRYSVQQVATKLHFPTQSAFGKFFKRRQGMSPSEFKMQAAAKA